MRRPPGPLFVPPDPVSRQQVTSADGVRLNVEIHGPSGPDVPTVVLVHGWSLSVTCWAPLVHALHGEARLVTYDQRGHGASETPGPDGDCSVEVLAADLAAVLDAVLPAGQQAVLAGHSMGGMTIMAAAALEQVRSRASGVLLASTGFTDLNAEALLFCYRRAPRVAAVARRLLLSSSAPMGPVSPLSRALLTYMTMAPGTPRPLATFNAGLIQACDRRSRAVWGRVLSTLDVGEGIRQLDAPTRVLVGSLDRLTPPVHAQRMASLLSACEDVTELPGVGHMTPLEAPTMMADAIRKLVAGNGSTA